MSKGFHIRYFEKVLGLVMILVLNGPAHVAAWGMDAHRVVGMIADRYLTPGVQNKIQQDFNITSLADVAN